MYIVNTRDTYEDNVVLFSHVNVSYIVNHVIH